MIRDGNRIRVHAQLIRATTDEHFWSETFDREAARCALPARRGENNPSPKKLRSRLLERNARALRRPVPSRLKFTRITSEAGPSSNKTYSTSGLEESIGYFEEATKRDPSFAPAYVGLVDHLRQARHNFYWYSPK